MSQDDDAREARAARLRARIDRITGHQPDSSDDATADDAGESSSGGTPDEPTRKGESAGTRAATGEQPVADESPRDFIQRKMRERGEGEQR